MNDHNLEQVVHIPTRQENTLYLFYINQPSLVQNTKTLPALGTSDHDIVFHEIRGVAAYTLSRHGVHIDRLNKKGNKIK
jgi:hypothetical protein